MSGRQTGRHLWKTPVVRGGMLNGRQEGDPRAVPVGSPAWFAFLDEGRTFYYEDLTGRMTCRTELRRGRPYWYGFLRRGGRTVKRYLGRADDLTLDRLGIVAGALARA